MGGLGNLLFQVSAGVSLALDNNDEYFINPYNHKGRGQGNHISVYLDNIFSNIKKTNITPEYKFEHISNVYKEIPYKKDMCIEGFFQSYNYIKHHKEEIKNLFNLNFINNKKDKKILTIQVRTGDYANEPSFNILNKNYYENSLNQINLEEYDIYLISDFPELAKKIIPDINYKIFHKTELHDIFLMSQSDVCIISNSTFGWWGSFLGNDKTTYAPYQWNVDKEQFEGIYRDDMIKVNF